MNDPKAFEEFMKDWTDFDNRFDQFRKAWSDAEEHGTDEYYNANKLEWVADWLCDFESDIVAMGWRISLDYYGRDKKEQ